MTPPLMANSTSMMRLHSPRNERSSLALAPSEREGVGVRVRMASSALLPVSLEERHTPFAFDVPPAEELSAKGFNKSIAHGLDHGTTELTDPNGNITRDLRRAATELVATAFLTPMFALLRESPLKPSSGPFAPGAAEKRFGPLLDEKLADKVVQASGFKLVDAIVNRYAVTAAASGGLPAALRSAKEKPLDVRA